MTKVQWGIIGCGDVTEKKSGPAFNAVPDSELVAVMRRDGAKAEDYAKRHGVAAWYDDADKLIQDPNVNAVYIATPPGNHMELALKVAAAGKPCYVEKPIARAAWEGREMVDAFEEAGVPLTVAYYRRALPKFKKLKQIMDGGLLGEVGSFQYRMIHPAPKKNDQGEWPWRVQAEHSGGGLFMDVGCHVLDVVQFLFGANKHAEGQAFRNNEELDAEDEVFVGWPSSDPKFKPIAGFLFEDTEDPQDELFLFGANGRLFVPLLKDGPIRMEREGMPPQELDIPFPEHVQQPMITKVVDHFLGRGENPCSGEEAMVTAELMDRSLDAYYRGRSDEFWKRPDDWEKTSAQEAREAQAKHEHEHDHTCGDPDCGHDHH